MNEALVLMRLRWSLTIAAMRKSVGQTVGYAICILLGLSAVVGAAALAWQLGSGLPRLDWAALGLGAGSHAAAAYASVLHIGVVLVGAGFVLFVAFIQLMYIGEGSTMSPGKFSLYGIKDRTLQFGLLLAGLSGLPAIFGVIGFALWSMAYRWMGALPVFVGVASAPLIVLTMMSFSKLVISLVTTLVRSKRGKGMFYMVVLVVFIVLCQLPNLLVNGGIENGVSLDALDSAAVIVAWTPFGAAFQLPFDAFVGAWGFLAARLIVLAVTWMLCFVGCTWCLKHERLISGASEETLKVKGVGAFAWMPDSVSGAISARLLTYMKCDPRQAPMFAMPLLFVVLFAMQSHGITAMVWQTMIWSAMFLVLVEGNGLAYDGRGFAMQVITATDGRADRLGRIRIYAAIILIYMLALMALCFVITGDWCTPDGILLGSAMTAVGIGVAFCGLGLAETLSCVLMYPVPSMDKPFSSPQGRAVAQGFFPLAHILGMYVLMLPTAIVALALTLTGNFGAIWTIVPVSLINGAGMLALGSWLGGKLLNARMLKVMETLNSFASLQK